MLRSPEFEVIEATSDRTAVRMLRTPPGLVLYGVDPDQPDALESLSDVCRKHPQTPFILLVASHPDHYSRALPRGAVAVLEFPLPAYRLQAAVVQVLEAAGSPSYEADAEVRPGGPVALEAPVGEAILEHQPDRTALTGSCTCTCHTEAAGGRVGEARWHSVIVRAGTLKEVRERAERETIVQALRTLGGNRQETAKVLAIDRVTLYKKMKSRRSRPGYATWVVGDVGMSEGIGRPSR
jgi:DNA-binding NtrC family response regulator